MYKQSCENSLTLYLQGVKSPILTREQEKKLAERYLQGDQQAKNCLICSNIRFVISIAKKYSRNAQSMTLLDLTQEGIPGLMKAIDKFDPTKGNRLSTYAKYWIEQSICNALEHQDRMVTLPQKKNAEVRKVQKAVEKMAKIGTDCDCTALAKETGLPRDEVSEILQYIQGVLSLDAPVFDTTSEGDSIIDESFPSPGEVVEQRCMADALDKVLATLLPLEKEVLEMRFGLHHRGVYTLEEVSNILGTTQEDIRCIEAKAIRKLRAPWRLKLLK